VLGGLGGLLVGLGALAIPGIGPVLAAGPLVSALAGAGIGAATGGLLGALVNAGIPEEHAGYYAEGVRRGGTLVTVQTDDDMAQTAVDILNRFGPVDVNRRSAEWRSSNWEGFDETADPYTHDQINMERSQYQDMEREGGTLEVVEEDLRVGKREVSGGGVRVHTFVTEQEVEEDIDLRKEHVDVERRPVDRPASPADLDAFEEATIEVTATSEEPVIEKRARVVEEVEIHKDVEHETETVRDTLRRKDVEVERMDEGHSYSDFESYEPDFRNHYQTTYTNTGYTYDDFQPAYHYGYQLASDPRYQDRDWEEIEMDARRDWEGRYHDSAWEDFKDAIRNAWYSVTGRR
jgi:uncharacterized protein (TIGR02271 family)